MPGIIRLVSQLLSGQKVDYVQRIVGYHILSAET